MLHLLLAHKEALHTRLHNGRVQLGETDMPSTSCDMQGKTTTEGMRAKGRQAEARSNGPIMKNSCQKTKA